MRFLTLLTFHLANLPALALTSFTFPAFKAIDDRYPSKFHKVHVVPIFNDEEAKSALEKAVQYAETTKRWHQPDDTRHETYATCDFPVEDCGDLDGYLNEIGFHEKISSAISDYYDVDAFGYLDLFCAHYTAKDGSEGFTTMDRLQAHRDGSLVSFSVLLNDPSEFKGGGTFFDALKDHQPTGELHQGGVIKPHRAGEAVFHCGKALHGADVVKAGNRTVIVGFVEIGVAKPGTLTNACRDWGRLDEASRRAKQRRDGKGWWLPKAAIRHGRYFSTFEHLVDTDTQRIRRLNVEDELLRSLAEEIRPP